jgi:hypothetical protein
MTPIQKMKAELKALALNIRLTRAAGKEYQRSGGTIDKFPKDSIGLWRSVPEFRHKHIAYCLARGKTYEQIESKVHEHNKLTEKHWEKINSMVKAVQDEQEALRPCAS